MKYKNISRRAARYASGKGLAVNYGNGLHAAATQAFADGYRLAMKEIRGILDTYDAGHSFKHLTELLKELACNPQRLK